jgi:hypothetical protein
MNNAIGSFHINQLKASESAIDFRFLLSVKYGYKDFPGGSR